MEHLSEVGKYFCCNSFSVCVKFGCHFFKMIFQIMLPHQVNSTSSVQINFTLCDITSWTAQNLKYAFDTSGSTCFAYWASHVPVQMEENVTGEMIKPIVRYWLYIQIEENVTGEMITDSTVVVRLFCESGKFSSLISLPMAVQGSPFQSGCSWAATSWPHPWGTSTRNSPWGITSTWSLLTKRRGVTSNSRLVSHS